MVNSSGGFCSCAEAIFLQSAISQGFPLPPNGTIVSLVNTLPQLAYATGGGLLVQSPLGYLIDGFPKTLSYSQDWIDPVDTNATTLDFLSNVDCAPKALVIARNPNLVSLEGINIWPTGILQNITMFENPLLTRAGFAPLGAMLQCGTESPSDVIINVTSADCRQLTTVAELCLYISTGCPLGPTLDPEIVSNSEPPSSP